MRHVRPLLVMIYALLLGLVSQAQTKPVVTPVTSTEGYEFFAAFLPNGATTKDAADLALQFLISAREVPGHPEIKNDTVHIQCGTWWADSIVPVNSTKVIDIEPGLAYWDMTEEKSNVETPLPLGVHIYSKNSVKTTVYAVNLAGADKTSLSSDGAHVLPKEALGYEYIVECNSDDVQATEFVIMSTAADTKVTIQLPDGVQTSKKSTGTLTANFLQPNMIYIVRSRPADPEHFNLSMDLSGTTICADHPIAVWSGNQAARFTTDAPTAKEDHAFDQLLPIDRWGKEFIVPMTGLRTQLNKLDIIARDNNTKVTLTTFRAPKDSILQSGGKWSRLIDAFHTEGLGFTLEDSTVVVKADKPIQVYLYTSSSAYNGYLENNRPHYLGDPSMTMITPLEHLTDTAVFTTYANPIRGEEMDTMSYELVVWAKKSTIPSLKLYDGLNDNPVSTLTSFKNFPGWASSDYQYARIPIDKTKVGNQLRLTATEKGFGGYVCGLEAGQAVLYPIGYDFISAEDSLFLSNRYEPIEVHTSEQKTTYPDKGENGGGYYLDRIVLPKQPIQYDTIFICDSSKLRFPAIIHNYSKEHGDSIKWEVMRIDQNKKRTEYKHKDTLSYKFEYEEGELNNPYLETRFYVLPEKNLTPGNRHPYEDFEVRAILYRKPALCEGDNKEKWPKDTLSTIVRTYRSYNDTTWLIRCDNDPDIIDQHQIKFFIDPATSEKATLDLVLGDNNVFTRRYTTVNGCDSVVTLCVLLCHSDVKTQDLGYLCEDEMKDLYNQHQQEFGKFFEHYDFSGTLKACKKNNNTSKDDWKYLGDNKMYWQFQSTDVILKTDCSAKMQEWVDVHHASLHPSRTVLGCDSSLTITFYVWPIQEYPHDDIITCETQCTWSFEYHWLKEQQRFRYPKEITYVLGRDGIHEGMNECKFDEPRATYPDGTEFSGCIGERHIVHITFLHHGETNNKEVELCHDDPMLIVNRQSDPDIKDPDFVWLFNPRDSIAERTYLSPEIPCENSDGCPYILQYNITVIPVETHHDTIVYCYEENEPQIVHKWVGHTRFWANVKGQPNTKRPYNNETNPLKISRNKTTPVIYELADTIVGDPCHSLYYQTVILQPQYHNTVTHEPVSTDQWFEWEGVIWAGDSVKTDTVRSGGKPIVVLNENPEAPAGWTVVPGKNMFSLTTTINTHTYKRDDGSDTQPCDSTVTMQVPMAGVQVEHEYFFTCSNETYVWQAGDTTINVNPEDHFTDLSELPKEINLEQHRKTIDDPSKTASPWPVAGLDAHFYLHLTIYPSWRTTVADSTCQRPGGEYIFKDSTFYLDVPGWQEKGRILETELKIWEDPTTHQSYDVVCDSGETVRLYVHPIYRENINKDLSTYQRTLYSHDTLTFFTEPKILYVGQDFFAVHPEIHDLDELKSIANVDSVIKIDSTLVDELHRTSEARNGMYPSSQLSSGTKELSCDSTTFLELAVFKTQIVPPVNLGDNGEILDDGEYVPWSFGGIAALGHTHPYITGDYFRFYYDENGNVIVDDDGNPYEVNYTDDYDRARDQRHWDYHANEDGTRTYLLVDSVLQADGTYNVIVQYVTVYPTFKVNANDIEELDPAVSVCATDNYHWDKHYDKEGNDLIIDVSKLDVKNREAEVRDTLCAKRYADRVDSKGEPLCVDSIAVLKLKVLGNGDVSEPNRPQCFNDPAWYPTWSSESACYKAGYDLSKTISNVIDVPGSDGRCVDRYKITVDYKPSYGILVPCDIGDQGDLIQYAKYKEIYVEPYNYDTVVCKGDDDFHWLLSNGEEHVPSNLYLYDSNGNPDNRYIDALGNATNKVPGNIIPTDLTIGNTYTVRDSLKTVACLCDSVLTLNYELLPAPPQSPTSYVTMCDGEVYQFGDTTLRTAGEYRRPIDGGGRCKSDSVVVLTVVTASSFTVDPSPMVCFPSRADIDTTYALHYSFRGTPPTSFSVYYNDEAKAIGFRDTINVDIDRPSGGWIEGEDYVLNLPMPRVKEDRQNYPKPGTYSAKIGFQNGYCLSDSLMTYNLKLEVNYPAWVLEQRHGDLIAILDTAYNGHHNWTGFQWYKNGQIMSGYTKPYLYVPEGLTVGAEYHVVLTETDITGATISSAPTCPIVVNALPNGSSDPDKDHGPLSDYIDVAPTCVPIGNFIYILSNEDNSGGYRLSSIEGQVLDEGKFKGKVTKVDRILTVEGMYIIQIRSDKKSKESYRAIKVIVRESCPYCDKSSF